MSRRFLPSELVDAVVDHNHDDWTTLLTIALVSRQWTPASRYHVFTDVGISHNNAREFIDLLISPHSTFTHILQSLNIELVPGSQRWFAEFSRHILSIGRVTITTLTLLGSRNTVIREEAIAAVSLYSAHLRQLIVGTFSFDNFFSLAKILCDLTALESFSCAATFRDPALPQDDQGLQCTCPLHSLTLISPAAQPALEFLLGQGVLGRSVSALALSHPAPADRAVLARYLRTSNSRLSTLSISTDARFSGISIDDFARELDLSRLSALRQLMLDTTPRLSPTQAVTILANVASAASLEMLEISVDLGQGAGRIDAFLGSDVFASLQRVKILGASWVDVRQLLPRCSAKNILQQA